MLLQIARYLGLTHDTEVLALRSHRPVFLQYLCLLNSQHSGPISITGRPSKHG